MSELPRGWAPATVREVSVARMGKTIIAHELVDHGLPVYSANRDDGPWGFVRDSDVVFDRGTIVVSARGTIGFIRLPPDERFVSTQTTIALRPLAGVLPEFLRYTLRRVDWAPVTSTTTIPMLTIGQINEVDAPLAPLNEQRRIVEKLDAVFDKSRAAKARLERLPTLLEKLKRSILAAAFRGDLTKDWRAAHPDVEPASVLLERIRAERRRRWEDGLRAKGKDPKKATYEEPAPVDVDGLPELPAGWAWASLGEVAPLQPGYAFPSNGFRSNGVRLLKGVNVRDGWLSVDELHHWDASDVEGYKSFLLRAGDIALAMDRPVYSSGSRATKVVVLDAAWDGALLLQRVGRFQRTAAIDPDYLFAHVEGPTFRDHIIGGQKGTQDGKDLPHVSASTVDAFSIPVPPLDEQRQLGRVLREVRAFLAREGERLTSLAARTTALEQAALAKAFRGELVPQDPSDEPASLLLDRIRAARADEPQRARRGRPARPADPELFAAKPAGLSATNGHGAEDADGEPVDLVVAAFQLTPRLNATSIGTTTGLDAASVKRALRALVEGGHVRVEGKARGTAYVWSG